MRPQLVEHAVGHAPRARLAPLRRAKVQDGHGDPIHVDAGIVARLGDRVLHEHRRDDEEPGRDRDLPPQQNPLTPAARQSARRPCGERAPYVDRAGQLDRRLEAEHDQREEQRRHRDSQRRRVQNRMKRQRGAAAERQRKGELGVHQDAQQLERDIGRHRAAGREDHALEALLAHEPPRRRAERAPHGELAHARRPTGEDQIPEVRAGDDEHERDKGHEQQAESPYGVVLVADRGHRPRAPRPIRRGVAFSGKPRRKRAVQACRNRLQFGGGGRDRAGRREAAEDGEPLILTFRSRRRRRLTQRLFQLRFGAERDPELRAHQPSARTTERGRRHADHLEALAGNRHGRADDAWVGREAPPPERVAQHHDACMAVVVGGLNRASERGADAERGEIRSAHRLADHHLRHGRRREAANGRGGRGQVRERRLRRLQIAEVRLRHHARHQPSAVRRDDDREAIGIADALAAQEHAVDNRVHGGRDRDAGGERQDRERREQRRRGQPPEREPGVGTHRRRA